MVSVSPSAKKIWGIRLGLLFPYAFAMYKNYGYTIENDRVIITKGIFFKKQTVVLYKSVEYTGVFQSPLQQHYNVYTVFFYMAGKVELLSNVDYCVYKKIRNVMFNVESV